MKKKSILSSIVTIALCLCLVAGSTFALFTSEAQVNVAVTAGKVNVEAYLDNFKTYSMDDPTTVNGVFDNGGTATYANGTLTLDNVTPGDEVKFDVNIVNNGNVDVQYRLRMIDEGDLSDVLIAHVHIPGTIVDVTLTPKEQNTVWMDLPEDGVEFAVDVKLPELVGNDHQKNHSNIKIIVEAVQANETRGNITVGTADQLMEALSQRVDYPLNITLSNDVEFEKDVFMTAANGSTKGKLVIENLNVTLDLNGKTLKLVGQNTAIRVLGNTELTITGDGAIEVVDSTPPMRMISAHDSSKVTVHGGTFVNHAEGREEYVGVSTFDNALVEIYGGTFDIPSAGSNDNRGYHRLLDNSNEGYNASATKGINVYGGKFVNHDPMTGYGGLQTPAKNSLVPEGYESVALGADANGNVWFEVVKTP